MDRLIVRLGVDGWVVDHSESQRAQEVFDLFGTLRILTPFTRTCPEARVVSELQRRNPGSEIEVRP